MAKARQSGAPSPPLCDTETTGNPADDMMTNQRNPAAPGLRSGEAFGCSLIFWGLLCCGAWTHSTPRTCMDQPTEGNLRTVSRLTLLGTVLLGKFRAPRGRTCYVPLHTTPIGFSSRLIMCTSGHWRRTLQLGSHLAPTTPSRPSVRIVRSTTSRKAPAKPSSPRRIRASIFYQASATTLPAIF